MCNNSVESSVACFSQPHKQCLSTFVNMRTFLIIFLLLIASPAKYVLDKLFYAVLLFSLNLIIIISDLGYYVQRQTHLYCACHQFIVKYKDNIQRISLRVMDMNYSELMCVVLNDEVVI